MSRLAIIGTGIAGLGCAHFLQRRHDLTLFEQNDYVGGHTNTVSVREPGTGAARPVDTGFMVFNRVTYPLLTRLFNSLDVPIKPSDMSFSVRDEASGLEWCGSSLSHLFVQPRNVFNLRFLRMLTQVARFNRTALDVLNDPRAQDWTIEEFLRQTGFGADFFHLYLAPMAGAVWSAEADRLLAFPIVTVLRFFHNHGFLGLATQHPWLTVDGGAREYRDRLMAPWQDRIQLGRAVVGVHRTAERQVRVLTQDGREHRFDGVIVATHADQARRLLQDARPDEQRLLESFRYQTNVATLHTDASVMPRAMRAWSSWNVQLTRSAGVDRAATHYWMNRLQGVSDRENYFVSINRSDAIQPARVLRKFHYAHPLFTHASLAAQRELPELNARAGGRTNTWFAGSYFRYGFHEDALGSAVQLCELLLEGDPWTSAAQPQGQPAARAPAVAAAEACA
jgi:uncharacterized protein